MFSHDPHQFCNVLVWSGRPKGFESNTVNMPEQPVSKVGLELLGQLKRTDKGHTWDTLAHMGNTRTHMGHYTFGVGKITAG